MPLMANPPFGTRTVLEVDRSWTVVVEGEIVAVGIDCMADAIALESAEIAARTECDFCGSTAGGRWHCADCGTEIL